MEVTRSKDQVNSPNVTINTKVYVYRASSEDVGGNNDTNSDAECGKTNHVQRDVTNLPYDLARKPDDDFIEMEIDESEMKFPIKSEERVEKERKMVINDTLYYEKRKALEVCDRADMKLLSIALLRKIGNKSYKTS